MTQWRKSSFTDNGTCVEIAEVGDAVAVRNSVHPGRGTLTFAASHLRAFVDACKAGEFDDFT